jgi:histidinol-phosphate/aromatic aminotransferase/cobyric acid decarboxylase-like protein
MSQSNSTAQIERFKFISGEHGGYHRYDFTDHAYLYNLYFPPDAVFRRLGDQIPDLVRNYPVAQDALAGLVGEIIGQPTRRIVVGNGASELIKVISTHSPRKLIVPVPTFNEYVNAAPSEKVIAFPLAFPSFQLDIERFAAEAIRAKAGVAVVVTPNNPTSMLIPGSDLVELARMLEPHDCMLVIDESFLDFAENPGQESMTHELHRYTNVAVLKSMSKVYGVCGLRIGYIATANSRFAESIREGIHIWNVNGFAEEFLRMLPDYGEDFIESCKQVRVDRDRFFARLRRIEGMRVFKPDANFVFCRIPDYVKSASEVAESLFIKHNIYIKSCCDKTQQDPDRYVRIASRTETENRRLVEALFDVMELEKAGCMTSVGCNHVS